MAKIKSGCGFLHFYYKETMLLKGVRMRSFVSLVGGNGKVGEVDVKSTSNITDIVDFTRIDAKSTPKLTNTTDFRLYKQYLMYIMHLITLTQLSR